MDINKVCVNSFRILQRCCNLLYLSTGWLCANGQLFPRFVLSSRFDIHMYSIVCQMFMAVHRFIHQRVDTVASWFIGFLRKRSFCFRRDRVLYSLLLILYICFLKNYEVWHECDLPTALYTACNVVLVLRVAGRLFWTQCWQLLKELISIIDIYGWKRFAACYMSLFLVACVVMMLASFAVHTSWNAMKDEWTDRLKSNVLVIEEDRVMYAESKLRPQSQGAEPLMTHTLYRYSMEDVQMECNIQLTYLADAHPSRDFVVWRRNGKPIELTDRHQYELSFREIPESESTHHRQLREKGCSEYKVKATLTIHLLRPKEFGSYTCHTAKTLFLTVENLIKNMAKFGNITESHSNQTRSRPESRNSTNAKDQMAKVFEETRNNAVWNKQFKDEFTSKEEFRLIKMKYRQEIIRSPPSSILSFTHSYWHVESEDWVEVDYVVNDESYFGLCPDAFHGCSKLLILYWLWGHELGERWGLPPIGLIYNGYAPTSTSNRFTQVHCLCEKAYGYHSVRYIRRYFNRTSNREELVEIVHPHTLVVVPREQHMFNVFANRSECVPLVERPPCEDMQPVCRSVFDFTTIKHFASVAVSNFSWFETTLLLVAFAICLLFIFKTPLFFDILACFIMRATLSGSMGFHSTACLEMSRKREAAQAPDAGLQYDVYLSYAENEHDRRTVHDNIATFLEGRLGFRVCARNRDGDVASNRPEIQGMTEAIEGSERVVICLSKHYLLDKFMVAVEAPSIVELSCMRQSAGHADVLIVKLDECQIPLWASGFEVHDWTSAALSVEDHQLRLMNWLQITRQPSVYKSVVDVLLTLVLLITGTIAVTVLFVLWAW